MDDAEQAAPAHWRRTIDTARVTHDVGFFPPALVADHFLTPSVAGKLAVADLVSAAAYMPLMQRNLYLVAYDISTRAGSPAR